MKTPMQELIEVLEIHRDKARKKEKQYGLQELLVPGAINAGRAIAFEEAISLAEAMLEKEKALLIKTHGNKKVYDIVTGEEWYNEAFNTKEI